MERIITTRKEHKCGHCGNAIAKGTKAYYMEGRDPIYEPDKYEAANGLDGKQVGVKYWKVWYCFRDSGIMPACAMDYVEASESNCTIHGVTNF